MVELKGFGEEVAAARRDVEGRDLGDGLRAAAEREADVGCVDAHFVR